MHMLKLTWMLRLMSFEEDLVLVVAQDRHIKQYLFYDCFVFHIALETNVTDTNTTQKKSIHT